MKKRFILLLLIFITGCSSNDQKVKPKIPEILNVTIETPETVKPNETNTLKALVKQGKETVEDANDVKFEIWKSGQEEHEMMNGKHQSKGIYAVPYTFKEPGTYFVTAHVTARDQHSMPKKEVTVVGPPPPASEPDHDEHTDQHAHGGVSVDLQPNPGVVSSAQESTLTATVQLDGQPVAAANIRFEIWQGNSPTHKYIDTVEQSTGIYQGTYTFPTKGTYVIKVHVEKGSEIHDHVVKTVNVK